LSKKKKVSIIVNTLLSGGAEKQAVMLASSLQGEYDLEIIVLFGNRLDNKFLDVLNSADIPLTKLSGGRIVKIVKLYKHLKRRKADVIFNYLLFPNLIGGVVGRLTGVSRIVGGIRSSKIVRNKLLLEKIIHNYVSHYTIFNNQCGYDRFTNNGFNSRKAVLIPNGIDVKKRNGITRHNDKLVIISVGRFQDVKNYPIAIDIIKELSRKYDIKYKILGWGSRENFIREYIKKLKLEEIIELIINPENISEHYSSADIYLQTSKFEGLSNTVMEAMTHALPLVVSRVGDNPIMVRNDVNGYSIDLERQDLFIRGLEGLICDTEKRTAFGEQSYNIITKYAVDEFKQKYISFIEI
jgi:glycosyltransferase involved in cell wall biosynthesis